MSAITATNLGKVYRYYASRADRLKEWACFGLRDYAARVEALQGVSLEVPAGESVGIIGRNGAGKSTLLKVLAGISPPTSGSLEVSGRVAAMIELGAQFHPDYTGRENLEISGILSGLSRQEVRERIREAVEFAELGDHMDHQLRTYSTGMQARLAFAASTLVKPEVLLVDEVLAVGDQYFVGKCVRYVQEFHRSGRTLVLVSHDLTLIRSLCRRALWIDHGRLAADGPSGEVCADYLRSVQREENDRLQARNRQLWALRSRTQRELAGKEEPVIPTRAQIQITGVRLLDGGEKDKTCFLTGETLTIRVGYQSQIRYDNPNVSVTIERVDGLLMTSHSSKDGAIATGRIDPGEGWFDLVFDALLLGPGSYWVHAAITLDEALAYGDTNFDRLERVQTFTVMASGRPYPVTIEHPVRWKRAGKSLDAQDLHPRTAPSRP
jgi:lipopolysaccharide transport system ATP-binding protein